MWLWNLAHEVIGLHVYELLSILLLAVILVVAAVHRYKQNKRDKIDEQEAIPVAEAGTDEEAAL